MTTRSPRKPTPTQCRKRKVAFRRSMVALLASEFDLAEADQFGCYHLETPVGTLRITPELDFSGATDLLTVYRRFDDVDLARYVLSRAAMNPHSGKWNFHGSDSTEAPEEAARRCVDEIATILICRLIPNTHYLRACWDTLAETGPVEQDFDRVLASLRLYGQAVISVESGPWRRLFWTPGRPW